MQEMTSVATRILSHNLEKNNRKNYQQNKTSKERERKKLYTVLFNVHIYSLYCIRYFLCRLYKATKYGQFITQMYSVKLDRKHLLFSLEAVNLGISW